MVWLSSFLRLAGRWGLSWTWTLGTGYVNKEAKMTLSETQCRHTLNIARLILRADELGFAIKVVEWNRTLATQKEYVACGKSKTMNSAHLENRATDLALFKGGQVFTEGEMFRPLGEFWESLGGRWGGRFGLEDQTKEVQDSKMGWDSDHFETRKEV